MTDRRGERRPANATAIVDDAALVSALADLASVLDIPPTPDIATAVRVRLSEGGTRARRSRVFAPWPSLRLRPTLLLVILALVALLVAAGVAAAIRFGLPGLEIIFSGPTPPSATALAPSSPTSSPSASAQASSAPPSPVPLDLGTPTTLAAAKSSVTFRVFVPDAGTLGGTAPAVYFDSRVIGGEVVLAYLAGPGLPAPPSGPIGSAGQPFGLIVTESRGSVDEGLLGKVLGSGTTVELVTVNGQAGFWISGRPHSLVILDASGQPLAVPLREVGDVLVWVQDGTLLRIESPLGLAGTLRIAQSIR
ncbi:MAG: hypothetical protein ACYDB6_09600 [Candidatus Limnocylindrales bacterium]